MNNLNPDNNQSLVESYITSNPLRSNRESSSDISVQSVSFFGKVKIFCTKIFNMCFNSSQDRGNEIVTASDIKRMNEFTNQNRNNEDLNFLPDGENIQYVKSVYVDEQSANFQDDKECDDDKNGISNNDNIFKAIYLKNPSSQKTSTKLQQPLVCTNDKSLNTELKKTVTTQVVESMIFDEAEKRDTLLQSEQQQSAYFSSLSEKSVISQDDKGFNKSVDKSVALSYSSKKSVFLSESINDNLDLSESIINNLDIPVVTKTFGPKLAYVQKQESKVNYSAEQEPKFDDLRDLDDLVNKKLEDFLSNQAEQEPKFDDLRDLDDLVNKKLEDFLSNHDEKQTKLFALRHQQKRLLDLIAKQKDKIGDEQKIISLQFDANHKFICYLSDYMKTLKNTNENKEVIDIDPQFQALKTVFFDQYKVKKDDYMKFLEDTNKNKEVINIDPQFQATKYEFFAPPQFQALEGEPFGELKAIKVDFECNTLQIQKNNEANLLQKKAIFAKSKQQHSSSNIDR